MDVHKMKIYILEYVLEYLIDEKGVRWIIIIIDLIFILILISHCRLPSALHQRATEVPQPRV